MTSGPRGLLHILHPAHWPTTSTRHLHWLIWVWFIFVWLIVFLKKIKKNSGEKWEKRWEKQGMDSSEQNVFSLEPSEWLFELQEKRPAGRSRKNCVIWDLQHKWNSLEDSVPLICDKKCHWGLKGMKSHFAFWGL